VKDGRKKMADGPVFAPRRADVRCERPEPQRRSERRGTQAGTDGPQHGMEGGPG
jgi:hypothetical protein